MRSGQRRWTRSVGVSTAIPSKDRFSLRLLDPSSELEIISYRISDVLFCTRAPSTSPLPCCWAFTTSHASTLGNQSTSEIVYQSQVFRCNNEDAVRCLCSSLVDLISSSIDLDLSNSSQFHQCIPTHRSDEDRSFASSHLVSRSSSASGCRTTATTIVGEQQRRIDARQ